MKVILKKYNKLFIILLIVVSIIVYKNYKDSHLTEEVYYRCEGELHVVRCKYYMFNENGKVYMIEQAIDKDGDYDDINNFEYLLLKHGIDTVTEKCNDYSYCVNTLSVSDIKTGVYSIDKDKVKIEWDLVRGGDTYHKIENTYFKIKKGELWYLNSDLEMTDDNYYPVENYNKWKKCRKKDNCDEVFSIEDPLNDIDYDSVYKEFEDKAINRNCKFTKQYAFKDITGDGVDEILIRRNYNENDWHLIQIYYINTWDRDVLPLGDDEMPYENIMISDVYEGGYVYISGGNVGSGYYKVSEDGILLDYYAEDKSELPSKKSLYDEIKDWKTFPRDEAYCEYLEEAEKYKG